MSTEKSVIRKLGHLFQGANVILGGRANTLLAAFFQSIERKKYIVFPSVMCLSPVMTAQICGFEPLFADVNTKDATIDPSSLSHLLQKFGKEVAAVIGVDLYGNRINACALSVICRKHGILLVEDAAQAIGVDEMGMNVDVCLLSFGHTKIIDCGGGGAIVCADSQLAIKIEKLLNQFAYGSLDRIRALSTIYREHYYALQHLVEIIPVAAKGYTQLYRWYSELFFSKKDSVAWSSIDSALDRLNCVLEMRREQEEVFMKQFQELPVYHLKTEPDGSRAPWRFSFLVATELRAAIVKEARNRKIDISTWYPSMSAWFSQCNNYPTPNGDLIGMSVINLWVDCFDKKSSNYIADQMIDIIRSTKV